VIEPETAGLSRSLVPSSPRRTINKMALDISTEALLAMPEDTIPGALKASLIVLAAPTLQGYPQIGSYVEFDGEDGRFNMIKAIEDSVAWGDGSQALVRVAATLWNGHETNLAAALRNLDDGNLRRVLLAIEFRRGWRGFREALMEAAENDKREAELRSK
jgi:hypothetical protein